MKTINSFTDLIKERLKKVKTYCVDCGKQIVTVGALRCRTCASREVMNRPERKSAMMLINLGKFVSQETREKMRQSMLGKNTWTKGVKRPPEFGRKISASNMGHPTPPEVREKLRLSNIGKKRSEETRWRNSLSKIGLRVGAKNPAWKGGASVKNAGVRASYEYLNWRIGVYKKDNYTCQKCGVAGKNLHAHHILNMAQHEKPRFLLENGVTLCKKCHYEFHKKYGYRNNTKEQVDEFLNK